MGTRAKALTDLIGAEMFKENTSKAKRKKKCAFMGTNVKAPADLTGADIFKEDTSQAKSEKTKPSWVPP